jgi:hypothetical protein
MDFRWRSPIETETRFLLDDMGSDEQTCRTRYENEDPTMPTRNPMQIDIVKLGRMGANMVRSHDGICVV